MDADEKSSGDLVKLIREAAPWIAVMLSIFAAVWSIGNRFSTIETTQTFQATEISQLMTDAKDRQAFDQGLAQTLASVQQLALDIKSEISHAP